ncbi:MAG: hypothetical protein ACLUN1_16625 [Odoribacter splanchnicus]
MKNFNAQYGKHSRLELLKHFILEHGTYIELKKGEQFSVQGKMNRRGAYIENGLLRYIHVDDAFKRELEQSIIGHSPKDDNRYWDDFRLDIDFKEDFPNVVNIECATTFHYKLNHNNNLLNGNLKCKSLMRNSRIDKNLPLIKIQQKTNMTIPLNKKLHFSVYGSYTLDKKRSVILPATSIPYKVGAGFSYEIGKHAIIKSQTNYQYNIIQKKWEWFFGAGVFYL